MFMYYISSGIGYGFINFIVQDLRDKNSNINNCQSITARTENKDNIDYEGDLEESEDSKDDFQYNEKNDDNLMKMKQDLKMRKM